MNQEAVVVVVLEVLERLGLRYVLAGSFANNGHGVPRMTRDADFVAETAEAPALRLAAIPGRDFHVSEEAVRDAVRRRGRIWR